MNNNLVKFDLSENILYLTLNNSEHQNTLSEEMIDELDYHFQKASNNPDVKVIILSSTGSVFCAGHNLKELHAKRSQSDKGESYYKRIFEKCSALMMNIVNNNKPVIASIDGVATAAGCQLVASCDLAYATENSKFATPGVNIGLFCSTPMVALSRAVNKKASMEMLLTGDLIQPNKAKEIGLINDIFTSQELNTKVLNIAKKIATKSKHTLKVGKDAFYKQKEMKIEDAYKYASSVMVDNILNDDAEEGIEAFIEKRKPIWKN